MPAPENHIAAEFLVEPFVEDAPGPHVDAAIAAVVKAGLDVEFGPFASTASGSVTDVAAAVGDMIRASMAAGATRLRIHVGEDTEALAVGNLHNALGDMIRDIERDLGVLAAEWDRGQKQAAVRLLDERGAFLLRGSVDEAAEAMGVSRITIYNYLNALESREVDRG